MSDALAIANLLAEYCDRFDAGDFTGFASLFTHGTWFMTAADGGGAAPVERWCRDNILLHAGVPCTQHATANPWLDIRGDAATARSTVTIWQALPDFPLQAIFCGRYHDTLRRRDDGWHFASRQALPDLVGDMSRHMRTPPPPGPLRRSA